MDLISKLNTLKSIEPEENWVVETRKKVLSEAPDFGWKITEIKSKQENKIADGFFSRKRTDLAELKESNPLFNLSSFNALFSKKLAVSAFAFIFLVSGGAFTVEASKSSLPGDSLYIVKITAENATLAVTPEDKKAEVEMRQVDKRLEEFDKISKNHSDPKQGEKIEMLLGKIEVKTNNSKEYLTKIEDDGVKAKIAKVINIQTKKSAEVLVKANENLPDVVRDEVSEKFASVADSNEKVNFESLTIRVELMTDEDEEEITSIVKEKVEEKTAEDEGNIIEDAGTEEGSDESDGTDQDVIKAETGAEEGAEDVDNTEDNAEESEETEVTVEDTKKELLEILEIIEGDIKGDGCSCEIDVDVECGCADTGEEGDAGEEGEGLEDGSEGDESEDEIVTEESADLEKSNN